MGRFVWRREVQPSRRTVRGRGRAHRIHVARSARGSRYRLYPRKRERAALETMLAQAREVYNAALAQCKVGYETTSTHQTALNNGRLAATRF